MGYVSACLARDHRDVEVVGSAAWARGMRKGVAEAETKQF